MQTKLIELEHRVDELERLADEVGALSKKQAQGEDVQPELSIKGERWYRGAREILVQQQFSGVEEFENCYRSIIAEPGPNKGFRTFSDVEQYINRNTSDRNKFKSLGEAQENYGLFAEKFQKARALFKSVLEETRSRELPVKTQLSFAAAASEFETAEELLRSSKEEAIVRASGVVARVALERHLRTVAEVHCISIQMNPPHKKAPAVEHVMTSLVKQSLLTPIQKSELDSLFKIANNCAHPKEAVILEDVERLIRRGKELASMIL